VLGRVARKALLRHGLLWPPNIHVIVPLLVAARGGSLLMGIGGDELLGGMPPRARAAVPAFVRRGWIRNRWPLRLPWLSAKGQMALSAAFAAEQASEPSRWRSRIRWLTQRRQLEVLRTSGEALAGDAQAQLHSPFLDPRFLASVAASGSRGRYATRAAAMQALFGKLLPPELLSRSDKAGFTHALWGEEAREFGARWRGEGVAADLVDAGELRRAWSSPTPDFRSATALQAAWLATSSGATLDDLAATRLSPTARGLR
jgi:asparagine synthetase B (glutamine-hydrolysing)